MSVLVAAASTFTSEAVTYPFVVLMRRMMMQSANQERIFKSPIDCLKFTLEREGFRGLYRGYLLSWIISSNRFLMMMYLESSISLKDLFG